MLIFQILATFVDLDPVTNSTPGAKGEKYGMF